MIFGNREGLYDCYYLGLSTSLTLHFLFFGYLIIRLSYFFVSDENGCKRTRKLHPPEPGVPVNQAQLN